MGCQTIKIKILREKDFKNMLNNQSLTTKKYFLKLKNRELKDKEETINREIVMPKDDMDKFEEQKMKKIRNPSDKLIEQNVMRNKRNIIRGKAKR